MDGMIGRVVRFVVISIFIGLVVRVLMMVFGIDKKLDGKNKAWDTYRTKEAKMMNKTGRIIRKTGEKIKSVTEKTVNQVMDKVQPVKNVVVEEETNVI